MDTYFFNNVKWFYLRMTKYPREIMLELTVVFLKNMVELINAFNTVRKCLARIELMQRNKYYNTYNHARYEIFFSMDHVHKVRGAKIISTSNKILTPNNFEISKSKYYLY